MVIFAMGKFFRFLKLRYKFWLCTPEYIASLMRQEYPQTVAFVLTILLSKKKALKTLACLPPNFGAEVGIRMGAMEQTNGVALDAVVCDLEQKTSGITFGYRIFKKEYFKKASREIIEQELVRLRDDDPSTILYWIHTDGRAVQIDQRNSIFMLEMMEAKFINEHITNETAREVWEEFKITVKLSADDQTLEQYEELKAQQEEIKKD